MARAPASAATEELPEADRLEGFPHPRATPALFGHEAAERTLAEAFAGGRMHHAWLIEGREGIGKATLAYRLAAHVLAAPADRHPFGASLHVREDCTASRLIRALSHPNLLLLRRPYDLKAKRLATAITVDEVRRLRGFLSLSAEPGAWRVVLVDSADDLNINAANALLKSLEEPPRRTLFLLVTSEPGRLLPTIRSRCRSLALPRLPHEALRQAAQAALQAAGKPLPAPDAWEVLLRLSDGSVRRLLALSATGGLDLYVRIAAIVKALPAVDWPAVHTLADELSAAAAEQRFELFFDLLLDLLARLVRAQATGGGTPQEARAAARLIGEARLASFAALWETVVREKADSLALNLDRKALILATISRLETVSRLEL